MTRTPRESETMLEALVYKTGKVGIHSIPVPSPGESEVLTKVVVSGMNPKDWKVPAYFPDQYDGSNQGDDIAGEVIKVGSSVTEFNPGDRVAAYHNMASKGGSYAEYAITPAHTTFHIPSNVSFEEAATIPLAAMTAAVGLYLMLGLPEPWVARAFPERLPKGGILVYGAASAVGAYVVQLARRSNIHPIIAVAGNGIPYVNSLLDQDNGDVVIDYRNGDESLVENIKASTRDVPLEYAYDAVSTTTTLANICKVLSSDAKLTTVLPIQDASAIPSSISTSWTSVGAVFKDYKDFGHAHFRLMGAGLTEGWFKPHPHTVRDKGLAGLESALQDLKDGKASATKYVFRIEDTPR